MNIKEFQSFESKVKFYYTAPSAYFELDNNLYKCDKENMEYLKNTLGLPYKASFYGLSRSNIGRILGDLKDEENEIFCYRIKNPKTNDLVFHAIVTEKMKVKKL